MRDANTVPIVLVDRTTSGRNSYGNATSTIDLTVVHGVFAPGGSAETTDAQDQVVTQPTVYLPACDLTAVDAIVTGAAVMPDESVITDFTGWPVSGDRWEVDGEPKLWPANPFTGEQRPRPLEVHLKAVSG